MRNNEISNSDAVIDSRDVISRIEELESERQDLVDYTEDALDTLASTAEEDETDHVNAVIAMENTRKALADWDASEEAEELKALQALASEAEDYAEDWIHGTTLIRDSYFTDYAREWVSDIGDMPRDIPPYLVIDWDATAENIKQDYTSVSFDGVDFWVR